MAEQGVWNEGVAQEDKAHVSGKATTGVGDAGAAAAASAAAASAAAAAAVGRTLAGHAPTSCTPAGRVAVLIPCYNEAITIAKVVDDFARVLPGADIYVYDNNSQDGTGDIARAHGAIVRSEPRQGKGRVVRQMLRDIDADYYVLVDGDDTYPAEAAPQLLAPLIEDCADMCVGDRLSNGTYGKENDRAFHGFGNNLVRRLIKVIYGFEFSDVMTGYRAFNNVFASTMPVLSPGFEIETELSIHAVDKGWRIAEVPIDYRDRPEGSESKLSTFSDGMKVLKTIMSLFKDYKPMALFGWVALICVIIGLIFGVPVITEFAQTGLVPRLPTALLAVAFVFVGLMALVCGLILDTVVKGTRKQYELDVLGVYRLRGHSCATHQEASQ